MRIVLTLLLAAALTASYSQDCDKSPAPCPHDAEIESNKDIAQRTQDNDNFKEDIQLEDRLRAAATTDLQRIAQTHGWQVYELTEQGISNPYIFISGYDWNTCPLNRRPPHRFRISFIIITNADSLAAWKSWTMTDLQQKSDQLIQTYQADATQTAPDYQKYQDSMQYYMQQYGDFLQSTQAVYMKDLQDKNQKAVDEHDRKAKALLANTDRIQHKMEAFRQGSTSTKASHDFDNYADNQTCLYAEGSIAMVFFDFNPYQADRGLDGDAETLTETPLTIPHASFASITANHVKPNRNNYRPNYNAFAFENPSSGALVLFASYLPRDKEYATYRCTYAKNYHDSKSTIGDIKQIPEDKVQNIALHVQGRKDKVKAILQSFDWNALDALLYKP